MSTYTVASFSGGKDSTAMILHMLELNEPLNEVVFCDTGLEFPEMYEHIGKIRAVVEQHGVKFTVLKSEKTFEFYLIEQPPTEKRAKFGLGWPAPYIRWCTKFLKTKLLNDYLPAGVIQCVGLAYDEQNRIEREQNKNHRHPLAEWGWTEADALAYCKSRGYDWGGLYEKFSRVSCWICPLQPVRNLRILWREYPDLWAKMERYDTILTDGQHNDRGFKDHRIKDYSKRFERELKAKKYQTKLIDWVV